MIVKTPFVTSCEDFNNAIMCVRFLHVYTLAVLVILTVYFCNNNFIIILVQLITKLSLQVYICNHHALKHLSGTEDRQIV